MRRRRVIAAAAAAAIAVSPFAEPRRRRIAFTDLPAVTQRALASRGVGAEAFPAYVSKIADETDRRVAEGEREHLIYYALQATRFTRRPPIEPAISARRFVDRLPAAERRRLLDEPGFLPPSRWPSAERDRVNDLLHVSKGDDERIDYFRSLVRLKPDTTSERGAVDELFADYVRVARFLYLQESGDVDQIARLYQSRAHSSDTRSEAGFGVYLGLGVIRGLEPQGRVKRALVVGPGMDLAPRSALIDAVPPQSYQPFAVADALLGLSLAAENDLHVHSIDVNPRVVTFLTGAARQPVTLHFFGGGAAAGNGSVSNDYRGYLGRLGLAIGRSARAAREIETDPRYVRSVTVRRTVADVMTAEILNIVTERLADAPGYDLVVATNVFSYMDDIQLALALANVGAMLRPGGYLIHNESRKGLAEVALASGVPVVQMRTAVLGGPADRPLYDAVWVHRRER